MDEIETRIVAVLTNAMVLSLREHGVVVTAEFDNLLGILVREHIVIRLEA